MLQHGYTTLMLNTAYESHQCSETPGSLRHAP